MGDLDNLGRHRECCIKTVGRQRCSPVGEGNRDMMKILTPGCSMIAALATGYSASRVATSANR